MDRPGVCQVPEGSGEQGKMDETGCDIICGAPTTLAVKGQMMMMMMMMRAACPDAASAKVRLCVDALYISLLTLFERYPLQSASGVA